MASQSSENQNLQYFQPDRLTGLLTDVSFYRNGNSDKHFCCGVTPPTMRNYNMHELFFTITYKCYSHN